MRYPHCDAAEVFVQAFGATGGSLYWTATAVRVAPLAGAAGGPTMAAGFALDAAASWARQPGAAEVVGLMCRSATALAETTVRRVSDASDGSHDRTQLFGREHNRLTEGQPRLKLAITDDANMQAIVGRVSPEGDSASSDASTMPEAGHAGPHGHDASGSGHDDPIDRGARYDVGAEGSATNALHDGGSVESSFDAHADQHGESIGFGAALADDRGSADTERVASEAVFGASDALADVSIGSSGVGDVTGSVGGVDDVHDVDDQVGVGDSHQDTWSPLHDDDWLHRH